MLPSWSNFFGEFSTFTSLWWIDVWFNEFPSEEIPGWLEYFKHVLSSCLFFCGVLSALLELDGVLPCPIFWFCIFLPGAFLDLSFPFILLCAKEIGSSLNFGSGGDIRFPNDTGFDVWNAVLICKLGGCLELDFSSVCQVSLVPNLKTWQTSQIGYDDDE